MALELVTFQKVKDFLQLEREESDYPVLAIIMPSVAVAVENYLGRQLESIERTEVIRFSRTETRFLDLKAIPISSISSVTVTELGEDSTLTEDEDFIISDCGIELLNSNFKLCKVTVIYTGGFTSALMPEDIQRAALIQTLHEFDVKEHVSAEHVSTEGGSITRPGVELLKEVKRILDFYKHPTLLV